MPPPTKGGALPIHTGKGALNHAAVAHSVCKAPHKSGSAMSGSNRAKKRSNKTLRRKNEEKWHYYINKCRKKVDSKITLSRRAMNVMGSFVEDMFDRLASEATNVAQIAKVKTLSGREIQMGVRLMLEGELLKYGMSEGTKAVHNYNTAMVSIMQKRAEN